LYYYQKSYESFDALKNPLGIIQSQQNLGVIYFSKREFQKADSLLIKAKAKAKEANLTNLISSIDLTLALSYIHQGKLAEAENTIKEGIYYAEQVKSPRLIYDHNLASYKLELKRQNYER